MQNTPQETLRLPGLTVSTVETEGEMTKFDLALFVGETERGIAGSWKFSTELFDEEAIARLSGHFVTMLQSVAAEPGAALGKLEMLSEAERLRQAAEHQRREQARRGRFKSIKPRAVSLPRGELVRTGPLPGADGFPLVIEPAVADFDLARMGERAAAPSSREAARHGAILFRGFDVSSAAGLGALRGRDLPGAVRRIRRPAARGPGGNVYGSTPYPADQAILFHNESSHMHRWPMKIWFLCVKAAERRRRDPDRRLPQGLRPGSTRRCASASPGRVSCTCATSPRGST